MRFPKLRSQTPKTLKVPDLAGGVNLRDGVSEVMDNQLTQAKNCWWCDGLLKTRPGIKGAGEVLIGRMTEQNVSQKMWPKVKYKANGQEYVLTVIKRDENIDYSGEYRTVLKFYWQSNEGTIDITWLAFDEEVSYFVTQDNSTIYLFTSNQKIHKLEYSLYNGANEFVLVPEEDYYVPRVLTDCKTDGSLVMQKDEIMASGAQFEGYNLLSDYYKMSYTAFNPDIAGDEGHPMMYSLLHQCAGEKYWGKMVIAELTTKDAAGLHTVKHQIVLESAAGWLIEPEPQSDGLQMAVLGNMLYFWTGVDLETGSGKVAVITNANEGLINNLVITAPYLATDEEKDKVFSATQCEWFGGGTEGIAGGTRLFLGGNTEEANKNLVVWSDLNNPLYFPENNYFRVGKKSTAVTGFGEEADMLFIFKENGSGIYYTKYQQNSDITDEDLINQKVVDYVASSVYFPLVQVNPNVGCSYPETIQLCCNRLVWLGDNGDVYTLVSESQYNERSVFCVSEMVRRDLKDMFRNGGGAMACDWNGYYCLMSGNKLYLMDYNCYGYTHVASYSKTEDANIRIPWYIWELPNEFTDAYMCESGGDILFTRYNDGESYAECVALSYALSPDNRTVDNVYVFDSENGEFALEKHPIQTVLRTKLFDFGEASMRKSVDKINLQLGNNGGEPITVKVITDQSEEEHDIYLTGTETQAYTPGYIDSKAIFPCARNVLRIGLEISSEGVVAVDGMELKYRTLQGGTR